MIAKKYPGGSNLMNERNAIIQISERILWENKRGIIVHTVLEHLKLIWKFSSIVKVIRPHLVSIRAGEPQRRWGVGVVEGKSESPRTSVLSERWSLKIRRKFDIVIVICT